jgi:hypothetical protein
LLCETDDESEITFIDTANMVKLRRVSSIVDLFSFSQSDSGLARILADFSDDDLDFDDDDTVIHHQIASSAYTLFADSVFVDLELEEDISMAALEELSFVEVSPFVHTNLPSPSVTPSFNTNMEDDLVAAFEQMDLVDPIIGEGPDFLFSPLHSSFLSHHPSFLEGS